MKTGFQPSLLQAEVSPSFWAPVFSVSELEATMPRHDTSARTVTPTEHGVAEHTGTHSRHTASSGTLKLRYL